MKLDDEKLDFKANGIGVGGRHDYAFSVEFYLPIDDKVRPPSCSHGN